MNALARQHSRRFSGPWWFEKFRSFVWVAIVTILIWVYADMEFTQTTDVPISIRLTTGKSKDIVLLPEPAQMHAITLKLRGSRSSIEFFSKQYRNSIVDFDLSEKLSPGMDQAIATIDIFKNNPEITRLGLIALEAVPSTISLINIDKVETYQVPVEFNYSGAELETRPNQNIEVRIPKTKWQSIIAQGEPIIKTIKKDLSNIPPETTQMVSFELIPIISSVQVELSSSTLAVPITIKQHTSQREIQVSLRLQVPLSWAQMSIWREYDFVRKDPLEWIVKINITGSRNEIESITPRDIDAYIQLGEDDKKPVSWSTRQVQLNFGKFKNVELVDPQSVPTVQFRLERKLKEN